jgi:hypothetical protein
MKSCRDVERKYREACKYRKKEWLEQDGKIVKDSLATDFDEIEGVLENIAKCLDWDGVDDYDYYYYEDYFLEESNDIQVRTKRDLKSNVPEFMIQRTRNKRSSDQRENSGKKYKNKGKNGGKKNRNPRKNVGNHKHGKRNGRKANKSIKK